MFRHLYKSPLFRNVSMHVCHRASMATDNMFLYWASGSVPCWRVLMCLEEKGITDYSKKRLGFTLADLKSEEVKKLNPRGQVPTFKDGNVIVNESNAICLYLEKKYPNQGTKLLPDDPAELAKVMQRIFELTNIEFKVLVPIMNVWFLYPEEQIDMVKLKPKYDRARREMKLWEIYLENSDGYLTGSAFNMADLAFFPHVANMHRYGLDLDKYPAIKDYYKKVVERPSVKATWPPHWLEKPGRKSILGPI